MVDLGLTSLNMLSEAKLTHHRGKEQQLKALKAEWSVLSHHHEKLQERLTVDPTGGEIVHHHYFMQQNEDGVFAGVVWFRDLLDCKEHGCLKGILMD